MATPKAKQLINEWQVQVDFAGPFCPLEEMEKALFSAPLEAKTTAFFYYLQGLHDGRLIHEELGGIQGTK